MSTTRGQSSAGLERSESPDDPGARHGPAGVGSPCAAADRAGRSAVLSTRIHALPEVAQYLYPGGRPRSPEQSAAWLQATLASYEQLALGHLAVLRKEDGA